MIALGAVRDPSDSQLVEVSKILATTVELGRRQLADAGEVAAGVYDLADQLLDALIALLPPDRKPRL